MKQGIISDTTKSAKSLAQDIARKVIREPVEVLQDVKEQTLGVEPSPQLQKSQENDDSPKKLIEQQAELQDNLKSARRMEALNRELEDIRKQDLFSDLQKRISEGEEIPLEDYPELSPEQKQVLQAEIEAVKKQKEASTQAVTEVPSVHSKPSRRFGAGQKQAAEKEQTRVEKPVPPSG